MQLTCLSNQHRVMLVARLEPRTQVRALVQSIESLTVDIRLIGCVTRWNAQAPQQRRAQVILREGWTVSVASRTEHVHILQSSYDEQIQTDLSAAGAKYTD